MRSARCLAEVLLHSDQGRSGVDTAINLMVDCVQRVPVSDEVSLLLRLRCEAVLCEGLIKRGDLNEAAAATRATLANLARLPPPRLRATVVAILRMQALQADALGALGQHEEAFALYRAAVRKVETDLKSPRDPALIALLEGLARALRAKGDEKEAEVQQRRARAIRLQVTGKSESSIQLDEPEPRQPWPRRTLAGIYALRGVNAEVLQHIAQQTWTAYKGPQLAGLDVVRPDETGQAFLLLRPHDKPWDPALAVASKQVLRSLAGAVETVNAGIALSGGGAQARGAPRIGVAPWYAVSEFLACEWWTWPVEERERIKREVFPALPGWLGAVDQHFEWLGRGVIQEGTVYLVTPSLRMTFIPRRGIEITALGPPELIDAWFFDLALATRWFTASSYEPLAPQPIAAPVARA